MRRNFAICGVVDLQSKSRADFAAGYGLIDGVLRTTAGLSEARLRSADEFDRLFDEGACVHGPVK